LRITRLFEEDVAAALFSARRELAKMPESDYRPFNLIKGMQAKSEE